jgi:hypothetical protein
MQIYKKIYKKVFYEIFFCFNSENSPLPHNFYLAWHAK